MSITRAKTSSVAQGPSTKKTLLGGNDVILGGSYDYIDHTVVGSGGASSITFTSIPSTYKHLQIRFMARDTSTYAVGCNDFAFRFNGDTGSNYSWHRLFGDGTTAASNGYASQNYGASVLGIIPGDLNTAGAYGAGFIDILDYANTSKYKTIRLLGGTDDNSGSSSRSRLTLTSNAWLSTSAITSIECYLPSSTMKQYSHVSLYGIK